MQHINLLTRQNKRIEKAAAAFRPDEYGAPFDLRLHARPGLQPGVIAEFTGTGDFPKEWSERQRYEIDAGRAQEPALYEPVYNIVVDSTLPRNVSVNRVGPGAVIFEEVLEGGEVKFATLGAGSFTVPIRHYAFGFEYSKDLLLYNELWNLGLIERAAGQAYNALLNHIHFAPILNHTYATANQTAGNTSVTGLAERYFNTIEDAIVDSISDAANPRRGPFALLVSTANLFTVEKALADVPQEGIARLSSALGRITHLIAYDGWMGSRGSLTVTYPGVEAGTAYLIDLGLKERNFRSFFKQDLTMAMGGGDLSRFIMQQVIYDVYLGAYADVAAGVQEITWPGAG